jgi:hypothetical protein
MMIPFGRKVGDRVMIIGDHPWVTHAGTLVAFEKYGLGWYGWRVKLDENCGECYASDDEVSGPPRVDSMRHSKTVRKVSRF